MAEAEVAVVGTKSVVRGKTRRARPSLKDATNDIERMKYFYQMRAKDPVHYVYTPEGDLRIQGVKDQADRIIPLRGFSALQPEELHAIEEKRKTDLDEIEAAYDQALLALRDAVNRYRAGGELAEDAAAVVRANEEVRTTSVLRSDFAFPSKWIKDIENPTTSDILLQQRYETRKMGYDVFSFRRWDLSMKDAFGHYREKAVAQQAQQGGASQAPILFITDTENEETGIFHPTFLREFVFGETRYVSPYQAFEGERFKELDNETIRKQILGTRSARTIHALAEKEENQGVNPEKRWEDILLAWYTQHGDFAEKLKATGSSKFHMADMQYAGQNYVDALEKIRTRLRENKDLEKSPEIAKESAITEEEQKQAKKAAIINNFRRRG